MRNEWQGVIYAILTGVTTVCVDMIRRWAVKRIDIWEDEVRREKDLEEEDDEDS
jgi:hypothetical protein